MSAAGDAYQGHRILEAMRYAPRYAQAIFERMRLLAPLNGQVLDFGAGDGVFVEKFEAGGVAVDCVEPDTNLRALLRAGSVFGDISEVPIGHYDFVYSVNVLEHIASLGPTLRDVHRSMRPGGSFFVFVPAFNVLWTSLDDEVGHVQRFTQQTLGANLVAAGFRVEEMSYFDSLGFPAALMVRCLEPLKLFSYSGGSVSFYDRYCVRPSLTLDKISGRWFGKNLIAIARK
jgi:SAM-dependent methyltransferase